MASLLIKNIGMLATACGDRAKSGKAQGEILTLQNAYVLVQDEQILEIGQGEPTIDPACEVIDAQGKLVTAGLVDAHTHLVFGGWRENELALKLHGVPYLDILAQGGGILSTVRSTRAASEDELFDKTAKALDTMLSLGTTSRSRWSWYPPSWRRTRCRKSTKTTARAICRLSSTGCSPMLPSISLPNTATCSVKPVSLHRRNPAAS